MRCPRCGSENLSVLESRADNAAIRRRRECDDCSARYTTYERIELSMPLVVKKDGARQPYERAKLKAGMVRSCEKRPVSIEMIDQAVEGIERKLTENFPREVPSRELGEMVMDALRKLDKIAYVRFASVYREFSDISQFVETLEGLKEKRPKSTPRAKKTRIASGASGLSGSSGRGVSRGGSNRESALRSGMVAARSRARGGE